MASVTICKGRTRTAKVGVRGALCWHVAVLPECAGHERLVLYIKG